eukprot:6201031-Pleurochrysis_carterae.AAC.2
MQFEGCPAVPSAAPSAARSAVRRIGYEAWQVVEVECLRCRPSLSSSMRRRRAPVRAVRGCVSPLSQRVQLPSPPPPLLLTSELPARLLRCSGGVRGAAARASAQGCAAVSALESASEFRYDSIRSLKWPSSHEAALLTGKFEECGKAVVAATAALAGVRS